ncbi:MAG TPA: SpoIIE family protein phosphatase [Actinomycetota bacterium]|nr:SpoIIE family protein phosphatase [Actinomycetota bacterium]
MAQEIWGPSWANDVEQTLESLREEAEVAHALLGLSATLAQVRSVEETLQLAVRVAPQLLGAERGFAATWDRVRRRFIVLALAGFDEEHQALLQDLAAQPDGLPVLRAALLDERTVQFVPDAARDPRLGPEMAERRNLGAYIAIPLERRGEQFGVLAVESAHPRRFGPKDEALARGIARQVAIAFATARQFGLMRELRAFGLNVGRTPRLSSVVNEVARGAQSLLSGDGGAVYLYDDSHHSLRLAEAHKVSAPALLDPLHEPWSDLLEAKTVLVARTGAAAVDADVPVAIVAAPILMPNSPLGGAILVFFDRSITLGPDETEALNVLSAQSAMAIENAQRFERQRRMARSLQQGLLATETPPLEGFHVDAVYEAASLDADIGGDFFDIFDLGEGRVGVVVGDVSGKGAEAAAQTAQAKYMLRAFAMRNATPASVLFHLNNALVQGFDEDRFATCMFAVFDSESAEGQVALAGHPPPLVARENGYIDVLEAPGTILGAFEEQQFEQAVFKLEPGDAFIAYTDGLTEARRDKELFGQEGLREAVAELRGTRNGLARRLYDKAKEFGDVTDDTVVLALWRDLDDA